jgi:hypothetical protein
MSLSQVIAAAVGGIPICHGSGGLTAHHKLGARTGAAPLMMGICLSVTWVARRRERAAHRSSHSLSRSGCPACFCWVAAQPPCA